MPQISSQAASATFSAMRTKALQQQGPVSWAIACTTRLTTSMVSRVSLSLGQAADSNTEKAAPTPTATPQIPVNPQ